MADANPEYFTDEVKLPAADTSADVSVEVVGKKGETASVKAETITSPIRLTWKMLFPTM